MDKYALGHAHVHATADPGRTEVADELLISR